MKILITGASGLLGNKIAQIALPKHIVYSGYNQHPAIHGTLIELDITNQAQVESAFKKIKPDAVIHSAALTNVDLCEQNPELAEQVNVEGTLNIVENSMKTGSFLLYVSTDYVFDGEKGDYQETDTPSPINVYGKTKLQGEKTVSESSLDHCIARTCVIYGAQPAAGKDNFALWVLNNLKNNKPMNIVTDQIISPTYNHNLAEMILEALERRLTGIYNLAGATYLDRYTFIKLLAEEFSLDESLITPCDSSAMTWAAKRPRNSTLNTEKASRILKNKPLNITNALRQLHRELDPRNKA